MTPVLTIEDKILKNFAIIEPQSRKILWLYGALFRELIPKLLREQPRIREEVFDETKHQISMYLRKVPDTSPEIGEAWQQEFSRRGFFAQLVGPKAARLQVILRKSLLSPELQKMIVYRLRKLTDPQVEQILAELRSV